MLLNHLVKGMLSYIPTVGSLIFEHKGVTHSARYCYSAYLRHLVLANKSGLSMPKVVAEIGPGESLGMGLCALLTGAEKYYGFDVVDMVSFDRNVKVLEELIDLFKSKSKIPTDKECSEIKPVLDDYEFPSQILNDEVMAANLSDQRISMIRSSLKNVNHQSSCIRYVAPWHDAQLINEGSVDMVFSQAVLEHVDDLDGTYKSVNLWLRNGTGFVSHQIDFKSHGVSRRWNGHWAYSDRLWRIIRGNLPFLINRQPLSAHLKMLSKNGFKIIFMQNVKTISTLKSSELAVRFQSISDEDLTTSGSFIQAVKV